MLSRFIFCLLLTTLTISHQFNFYRRYLKEDCLIYYVLDDIVNYEHSNPALHPRIIKPIRQLIPYCLKQIIPKKLDFIHEHINLTFSKLRTEQITALQLYQWSATLDVIERYQMYLNKEEEEEKLDDFFLKCTSPWFGEFCQFTFDQFGMNYSLNQIVKSIFLARENFDNSYPLYTITNLSCYTHLECNRGPPPACLDWREICDGKIDCLDGGQDEKQCEILEINECEDNEYRCHNGQCIPDVFLNDGTIDPECLDRSDELASSDVHRKCFKDPSFRCEELSCRAGDLFTSPCGDGQCAIEFDLDGKHLHTTDENT